MAERRCTENGCDEFPDAAWAFCSVHLAEREERMRTHGPQADVEVGGHRAG